ncbi:Uncharacterized protein dnm_036460 [Desulfonema magnum]|uniref:Uncharacterized protein n=1 Tax=Desulfonema magnum TaxID=45655 RepID=A0A975GP71_9BACT|nr:Uncharacterized protein dnm_036460 [Desulfonema magnum]
MACSFFVYFFLLDVLFLLHSIKRAKFLFLIKTKDYKMAFKFLFHSKEKALLFSSFDINWKIVRI